MKIKNETLKKLTNREALDLGLIQIGCMFVRGEAKARIKNYKTVLKTETEMHYENEVARVELIALDSKTEVEGKKMQDWCVRVFSLVNNNYINYVQPLFAIRFVK